MGRPPGKKTFPRLTRGTGLSIFPGTFGVDPGVLNAYAKIEGSQTQGGSVPEKRKA